jgi:ribonucleoside-triphosphate reductase
MTTPEQIGAIKPIHPAAAAPEYLPEAAANSEPACGSNEVASVSLATTTVPLVSPHIPEFSANADLIFARTYCRPLDEEGTRFETHAQVMDRVTGHQRWLWERAQGRKLSAIQEAELDEMKQLLLHRKASLSGRTLWLGGTELSKQRELSQFNCAGLIIETVHDMVDLFWLLLNGCGPGSIPRPGTLNGLQKPLTEIKVTRSRLTVEDWKNGVRGRDHNIETFDAETGVWTISVGDSAVAWAKSLGKLLAGKWPASSLHIDLSQIRSKGVRLSGYGWVSKGDKTICDAYIAIARILSSRAGQLLRFPDMHDIINWCGTILSTRRSAEIVMCDYDSPDWHQFATFKSNRSQHQRHQSNNSLVFDKKPTRAQLREIFDLMVASGGSEPGFVNRAAALKRAPWFAVYNPCVEIMLPNKGFCNLVNINLAAFKGDMPGLQRAAYIMARANYRQTCVDLRDGVLQEAWHQNQQFLRLCGVSLTGQAARPDLTDYDYHRLQGEATHGAYSMSDELGMPRPKLVTTGKPEGTISKTMDAPEGAHWPLSRYIFNSVVFSDSDPLVNLMRRAGYKVVSHPTSHSDVLAVLPVAHESVQFGPDIHETLNTRSAIEQLDYYRRMMRCYVQHNQSITISYDPSEIDGMCDWLMTNWDDYCGVSFIFRTDPTKTAEDLGYAYLPQQPVSKEVFDAYVATLLPIDVTAGINGELLQIDDCAGGACPVR